MQEKQCFKCGEIKPLTDYYKHKGMADGRLGKCKACAKRDVRQNRNDNVEYYREFDRQRANLPKRVVAREAYAKSERGKERLNAGSKAWRRRNAEKRAAHIIFNNAKKRGEVVEEPCEVCGTKEGLHGHHDDHSKPLEVRWLCFRHHLDHHNKLRADERQQP